MKEITDQQRLRAQQRLAEIRARTPKPVKQTPWSRHQMNRADWDIYCKEYNHYLENNK